MKICIPTQGNKGNDDLVNEHFGSAPYFTIFDSEKESLEILPNSNHHHAHGNCHLMRQLTAYNLDGIVCSGIGRRAIEQLQQDNIKVYISPAAKVSEIIEQVKANSLKEIDPSTACYGHAHNNMHRHEGQHVNKGRGGNRCR